MDSQIDTNTKNIEIQAPSVKVKKDGSITKPKKKSSNPRATPRPYKQLTMERLVSTIDTLKERVEVADNRLQTYNIRLKKLNIEMGVRNKQTAEEM
jgi:hypothetical protein